MPAAGLAISAAAARGPGAGAGQSDKDLIANFLSYLGGVSLELGQHQRAAEHATAALAVRREHDMHLRTTADLATLAAAHSAIGDSSAALDYARQALALLNSCGGEGPEAPPQDYFLCAQVLVAASETEAACAALTGPLRWQSFLEQAPINRRIIGAAQRVRGLSAQTWFART
ncbi:MAG TPA: tetratricopeptide repeat protein [Roseiflexaceae bacterium]|nr:tetratricopeptide repeat protein [Roseiflexaceae bacterium]